MGGAEGLICVSCWCVQIAFSGVAPACVLWGVLCGARKRARPKFEDPFFFGGGVEFEFGGSAFTNSASDVKQSTGKR